MENPTETSVAFTFCENAESQKSDVREDENKFKKTGEVIEDKDSKRLSSTYAIMTMNMNGVCKIEEEISRRRRELIISTIKDYPASVIFCQEVPGYFEEEVVANCGNYGSSDRRKKKSELKVAVMWRKTDFQGKTVDLMDKEIEDRLGKDPNGDVSEMIGMIRTRTAMVKLTSKKTKGSFLAVSWHGPWNQTKNTTTEEWKQTKLKVLNDLDFFLRNVCKEENLSSFIVGGDFNLNTRKVTVDPTQYERVKISRYKLCARDENKRAKADESRLKNPDKFRFTPYKDTFIVSVTVPCDKGLMAVDITVSEVKAFEPKNESSENPLLDHVPVMGVFKLRGKLEQNLIYSRAVCGRLLFIY